MRNILNTHPSFLISIVGYIHFLFIFSILNRNITWSMVDCFRWTSGLSRAWHLSHGSRCQHCRRPPHQVEYWDGMWSVELARRPVHVPHWPRRCHAYQWHCNDIVPDSPPAQLWWVRVLRSVCAFGGRGCPSTRSQLVLKVGAKSQVKVTFSPRFVSNLCSTESPSAVGCSNQLVLYVKWIESVKGY